jgi:serine/threonine protein kinase
VNPPRFTFVRLRHDFKGWVRSDFPAESIADVLNQFDNGFGENSARLLKDDGKSRVVQQVFEDQAGKRWDIVVKRVRYSVPLRRLGFLFFASPASRSLRGALLLQQGGIGTARPLAAIETYGWEGLGTSYYFAETVENGKTLYVAWKEAGEEQLPGTAAAKRRRHLLKQLSAFVCRIHGSGIYHRDLKGSNIIVQKKEAGTIGFVLIDLDRVRKNRAFRWRKRIKNLIQVCRLRRLSDRDKVLFLSEYSRQCGISKQKMKSLVKRIVRLTRSGAEGSAVAAKSC